MTGGDGFVLGVDFGTSNTVAMLRRLDGRVTPLLFDGTPVLPSAVFAAPDGALFVGRDALHHGRHRPGGLEPNPKRRIDDGTVLLSGTVCAVPDLIGAVLGRVADEATRVAGHRPSTLVLSHPAGWGPVRRLTLTDAASAAGLPTPVFVPEPVAAAMYFTSVLRGSVPSGAAMLVYDLGAGTFDVTVLRAGRSFEVLGTDGLDDVGGLDVDGAVVTWLRDQYDDASWERLARPTSAEDRRLRLDLWSEAKVAKEMLSRTAAVVMRPPLLGQEIPLTLAEFERITQPLVDRTVRTARGLARFCEVKATHVLLVGGSSRIPLVATALHRAFGVPPTVTEQPETVVAEGCVFAPGVPPAIPPASALFAGDRDPIALSTLLPIGAGLTTEPFTADFGPVPGALPAAPLGRTVLPAVSTVPEPVAPQPPAASDPPTAGEVPEPGEGRASAEAVPEADTASVPVAAPDPAPGPAAPAALADPPALANPPAPAVPAAALPASALPRGAIPGARAGEPDATTSLLWPPLPPAIASYPLAGAPESTTDTARLIPVSQGTARNAGPTRHIQRSPVSNAPSAPTMSLGPTTSAFDRSWPPLAPLPANDPVPDNPVTDDPHTDDPHTDDLSPDWSVPLPTRMLRIPPQPGGPSAPRTNGHAAGAAPPRTGSPAPPRQSRPVVDKPKPPARPAGPERIVRPGPAARARVATAMLSVVFLLAAAAVTLIVIRPTSRDTLATPPSTSPPFPTWAVRYADSLGTQRGWSAAADVDEKVECAFRNGRLEVDMRKGGIFRCPGQRDELTDFALRLDVFLLDGRACAGIWFRRGTHESGKDSSYVLKICRTGMSLGHHHADGDIVEFASYKIGELGTGVRSVVGLVVRGRDISLYIDDVFVGEHSDPVFTGGRMALGIAVPRDLGAGRVGFSNIELRTP